MERREQGPMQPDVDGPTDPGGRSGRPLVFAHRGASAFAPENTFAAFALAATLGAQMIEVDVRLTRDRHLLVCHDGDVARTTNGAGAIHELDLEAIQRLDAGYRFTSDGSRTFPFRGAGCQIPTLGAALEAIPETIEVNVEIKASDAASNEADVVSALLAFLASRRHLANRLLISSFSRAAIERVIQARPEIRTGYLFTPDVSLEAALRYVVDAGHKALHPHESMVRDPSLVEVVHSAGVAVNVWTVDDPARMRELIRDGVDGIITNRPDLLVKEISRDA